MSKEHFWFNRGDKVRITVSGEEGTVTGRADYDHEQDHYRVRYAQANGVAATKWWSADALEKVIDPS